MKKNGFAFIETIITIVVLSSSLLYLYHTYSAILTEEEKRLYYDDPAFIYKANYVRKFLEEYGDLELVKNTAFNNTYIVTIGSGYERLFNNEMGESFENIVSTFKIHRILLIDSSFYSDCINDSVKCDNSYDNVGYNLKSYINTINLDSDYYLVLEMGIRSRDTDTNSKGTLCVPNTDKYCDAYYVSLEI